MFQTIETTCICVLVHSQNVAVMLHQRVNRRPFPHRSFVADRGCDEDPSWVDAPKHKAAKRVLTHELLREEPIFTELAFTRLLAWLDDGVDSHGDRYLEMRRRLVSYFDRRNRPDADGLADETLNRVSRTLEQTGAIATRPPARYCYVIARFVLLEDLRRNRRHVPFDEPRSVEASRVRSTRPDESAERLMLREQRLDCLDHCLGRLKSAQRDLAIEYYRDARRQRINRRRDLARRLGITMNALAIRACRIRDALLTCVEGCRSGTTKGLNSPRPIRQVPPD